MPSIAEHSDVLVALISGLFLVLGFFLVRTLNLINKNQTELAGSIQAFKQDIYSKVNHLSDQFNVLKGEHNALTRHGDRNPHCRKEDETE